MRSAATLLVLFLALADPARAQDCARVLRFESLRANLVNLRTGPSVDYPVEWVLARKDMPVAVVAEYEHWRRICDFEGDSGWVHRSMLSARPTAIVIAPGVTLRRQPAQAAPAVARVEAMVIGGVEGCGDVWCRVEIHGHDGWVERAALWGALVAGK